MANATTATAGAPHRPTRVMTVQDVKDVHAFIEHLETLLANIPVWIDFGTLTIIKAGNYGPEDELGTVQIQTSESEETTVHFKPCGS